MNMHFGYIPAYSAYIYLQYDCIFSVYHDIIYCSWKDLFVIYMHMLQICSAIYSTWKTQDGRKYVKNFGVLGVSGLNK